MASARKIIILAPTALTAASTDGDKLSLDPGAVDAILFLDVSDCHEDTTVTAKVQHSPDGSNWFDLVTFTDVAGAAGRELKFPSTVVLHLLRASVVLAGTTKSATVAISAHVRDAR